ncbi:Protein of unknown function, DUF538 [Quillaja saponaria]|uniref:Uncharacterized protein n=1 Tax=Quillaja saponaria TaxID=32244 RepID=A0AAD7VJ36_QUISA|nr:Protein of unknown function, DUF538 [Quillaja saponaria]
MLQHKVHHYPLSSIFHITKHPSEQIRQFSRAGKKRKMGLFYRSKPISSFTLLLSILVSLSQLLPYALSDDKSSAYEVLEEYGFPVGILPKGITGYELNKDTGEFSAYLDGTCSFHLENSYKLSYKSTIEGVISNGRLRNLKGVSVQVVLVWLNIVEVVRHGDNLQFWVGIISANFPVNNFEESPQCGCGLDCHNNVSKDRLAMSS